MSCSNHDASPAFQYYQKRNIRAWEALLILMMMIMVTTKMGTMPWCIPKRTSPRAPRAQRLHWVIYCSRLGVRPYPIPDLLLGPAHTVILRSSHLLSNAWRTACPAQFPLFLVAACGCSQVSVVSRGYQHTRAAHARLPEASCLDATL